jgi:transcription elongation GreA/GreB family factor
MSLALKQKLYELCTEYLLSKLDSAKQAIKNLQDSANEETKSSAGDKYETGRAMIQLEIEKYMSQVLELQKQKKVLEGIKIQKEDLAAQPGSLISTNNGMFFLAISAGQFDVDGTKIISISSTSPIGAKLLSHRAGDSFSFNGREFKIETVI